MTSRYVDYEGREDGYVFALQHYEYLYGGKLTLSTGFGLFESTTKESSVSASYTKDGWNFGFGYKKAYVDGNKNAISTTAVSSYLPAYFDNYRESQVWDFSIGYDFGAFKTNLAYLHAQAENTRHRDDLLVQTNRYTLNKYFDLFWINAYINSKGIDRASDNNNKGYAIVTGIALKY